MSVTDSLNMEQALQKILQIVAEHQMNSREFDTGAKSQAMQSGKDDTVTESTRPEPSDTRDGGTSPLAGSDIDSDSQLASTQDDDGDGGVGSDTDSSQTTKEGLFESEKTDDGTNVEDDKLPESNAQSPLVIPPNMLESPTSTALKPKPVTRYPVSDYFSKESNPAKLKMRRLIRKGASEAEVLGVYTYKDVSPGKRKHILDRVLKKCPELSEQELMIDEVIKRVLIQAKYYRASKKAPKKKGGKRLKKKMVNKNRSRDGKSIGPKKGKAMKVLEQADKEAGASVLVSPYELQRRAKIKANKRVEAAILTEVKTSDGPNPGDTVLITYKDTEIAECRFVKKKDPMYAELVFCKHAVDTKKLKEVDLYEVVGEDVELKRKEKKFVAELEGIIAIIAYRGLQVYLGQLSYLNWS